MQTVAPPTGEMEQRFARTDERIVDVGRRISEVDRRVTEFKEETHRSFDALTAETRALRKEMATLQATVQRGNYTMLAAMLGLIAAILAKGG